MAGLPTAAALLIAAVALATRLSPRPSVKVEA
jgi:hypothetical protein